MIHDIKYTQTDLLRQGFSKKLIESLLPEPALRRNPHYKRGPQMKLYDAEAVEIVMKTEVFLKHMEGSAKRKEASKKAVRTKISNLMAEAEEKISQIRVRKVKNVVNEALEAKREWYEFIESYNDVYCAHESTRKRWTVNYIRHNLTDYDNDLYEMAGKPGCHEAYLVYKNGVLDKIAEVYPELKEECDNQKV